MKAGSPEHVALWEAIHEYVRACGGDPDGKVYGATHRQCAVVDVETAVGQVVAADHKIALKNEREAICEMIRGSDDDPDTEAERILLKLEHYIAENPTAADPTVCSLLARLCEASANELAEWQAKIRDR